MRDFSESHRDIRSAYERSEPAGLCKFGKQVTEKGPLEFKRKKKKAPGGRRGEKAWACSRERVPGERMGRGKVWA